MVWHEDFADEPSVEERMPFGITPEEMQAVPFVILKVLDQDVLRHRLQADVAAIEVEVHKAVGRIVGP